MTEQKKRVSVKRTTTIIYTEDQVKQILRVHAKAPDNAEVEFDDNWFSEATVKWSVETEENEP